MGRDFPEWRDRYRFRYRSGQKCDPSTGE